MCDFKWCNPNVGCSWKLVLPEELVWQIEKIVFGPSLCIFLSTANRGIVVAVWAKCLYILLFLLKLWEHIGIDVCKEGLFISVQSKQLHGDRSERCNFWPRLSWPGTYAVFLPRKARPVPHPDRWQVITANRAQTRYPGSCGKNRVE
jgi:hypothetical protein